MTVIQDVESSSERGSSIDLNDEKVPLLGHKRASFGSSVFNLSCTIVGAGIMSLPAAMKVLGVVPGVILIIVGGFLTQASIEFLLRFSDASCSFSYCSVMEDAFGRVGKFLVQLCVVVNNIGMSIIYLIIIEDVLSGSTTSSGIHHPGVLEDGFGQQWWTERAFVLLILTLFVFMPLIWCKRIDSLRYTSAVAVALAVFFIVVVVAISAFKLVKGTIQEPAWFPRIKDLESFWNLFTAVPVLVCAYLCHFNVHPIQNELKDPCEMQAVVRTSLSLSGTVYLLTGLFGFLLFGDSTASDVLSNFDTDLGVPYSSFMNNIVRVSYAGHIILVFPIIFYSLRLNFDGLMFCQTRPLASDNWRFTVVTLILMSVILYGAIFIPSIWQAFEFTGATAGSLLLFIFPASIVLKDRHGIATTRDNILAVSLIVVAVFADGIAIYSNASSLITKRS
ncbi:amino acid transporter AVT6A [Spinacia oleracea]|uniref:Amino acid transporter AVT6A n=1 Tax=Spinacia oleracea TaxID=3562 RepID=A0A9R0JZ47_SPIOL|nr:amino acid transporter AVT6A-like [Spinacia oleracea]